MIPYATWRGQKKNKQCHGSILHNSQNVETDKDFILGGSKTSAYDDYSHEIKTLAPWKKSCDHPRQHIKKQRHYLPTQVHLVKAMVFPVVMYGCESWTVKKAEH